MQPPVFAANWKMHHGPAAARAFVAAFLARFSPRPDRTVVLFPPALSVHAVVIARAARTDIKVGVQNIHTEEKGAFTGENCAPPPRAAGRARGGGGGPPPRRGIRENAGLKKTTSPRR
jgi:triosephosphate isomerase (TIM)